MIYLFMRISMKIFYLDLSRIFFLFILRWVAWVLLKPHSTFHKILNLYTLILLICILILVMFLVTPQPLSSLLCVGIVMLNISSFIHDGLVVRIHLSVLPTGQLNDVLSSFPSPKSVFVHSLQRMSTREMRE